MSRLPGPQPDRPAVMSGDPGSTPWEQVLEAYLAGALESAETRRSYRRHITDALRFMSVQSLSEVTGATLADYRGALISRVDLAPSTHAQALAALRSFLRWSRIVQAHSLTRDTIDIALRSPKGKQLRQSQRLSDDEIGRLFTVITNHRDRALLAIMLGAGLRVSEVVALDVRDIGQDVRGEGGTLFVRRGKGRRDREVPVHANVEAAVRAHLAATGRSLGDSGPLFQGRRQYGRSDRLSPRLSVRAVGSILTRCGKAAGIEGKRLHPHVLRHTYAIRNLLAGANIMEVRDLLGHASVTTTQRYLDHLQVADLRRAIATLPIVGDGNQAA